MPIHFDFTVSDVDAETIMDAVHQEELKARDALLSPQYTEAERAWFAKRAEYLAELRTKMTNWQVADEGPPPALRHKPCLKGVEAGLAPCTLPYAHLGN